MTAIWDFEDLDTLEESFNDAFETAQEAMVQIAEQSDAFDPEVAQRAQELTLERVIVEGEWANDLATEGSTILNVIFSMSMEGVENENVDPAFDEPSRAVTVISEDIINGQDIDLPDELFQKTTGVDIRPAPHNILPQVISLAVNRQEGDRVFDLTLGNAIELPEGVNFRNAPRIPLEILRQDEEEPEEDEEPEEEVEEEPEEEELTVEEELAQEFPDIPSPLRRVAVSDDKLEVTTGKKDTKTVEPREPYDFEIIQMTDRPNPLNANREGAPDFPFSADPTIQEDVKEGIGVALATGAFTRGENLVGLDLDTPANYPKTGTYIRNYLKFEGPSYALRLFKEQLVYLAYVNWFHDFNLRVGTYNSFREYIYVLRRIPEEGGPELITPLTQNQASSRGLQTIPDHPTIEGEKAPWLERRQWYTINEDNEDHPAWNDPYEFLHGESEEE